MIERDDQVQRARSTLRDWVYETYRDPAAAWREVEGRRHAEGGAVALERALRHGGPELLGELRGKVGWLASASAKAERARAEQCGGALAGGLERVREAEARVEKAYVSGVEAQRARDLVEVPGLSPAAWAALRVVEQAGEQAEREATSRADKDPVWGRHTVRLTAGVAEAWEREVVGRREVAAELQAVVEAAGQRLGDDAVRTMLRAAHAPQGGGQREDVAGLTAIGRVVSASSDGRLALESVERTRESQRQSLSPRQGMRPRM